MDKRRDDHSFYEYSSFDEDSFSQNNKSDIMISSLQELSSDPIESISNPISLIIDTKFNLDLNEKLSIVAKKDKLSLSDHLTLKGNYKIIIKSQTGARIIQELISKSSLNIITEIFDELKFDLADYYKDTYSNYFMQKLYFYLDPDCLILTHNHFKIKYLEILFKDLVDVSSNRIGTFALQKLMDNFTTNFESDVMLMYLKDMPDTEILKMAYVSKLM